MSNVSHSHTFAFSLYGVPSLDEIIAELTQAKQVMGGTAKCKIKSHEGDQRDGYSMAVTVSK